jgi:glutamate-ammonia-ligase adenylyltransferase
MTPTSDLDPIIVYDAPEDVEASDGPRPLPVSTYYARLAQRLINALTAPTAEGQLYEVDMRLRPSGNAGPIASSLTAFQRYHAELAWTWEQMALTRARPTAGDAALGERVMALVWGALRRPRDPQKLVVDVADMRRRMAAQRPNPPFWDVKHRRGGMIDVEFLAQYLELLHAAAHPSVIRANTPAALERLAEEGCLDRGTAADLLRASGLWRRVQSLQKLLVAEPFDERSAPETLKAILARDANAIDFVSLKNDMTATAERVLSHFARIIDEPAAAATAARSSASTEEKKP